MMCNRTPRWMRAYSKSAAKHSDCESIPETPCSAVNNEFVLYNKNVWNNSWEGYCMCMRPVDDTKDICIKKASGQVDAPNLM